MQPRGKVAARAANACALIVILMIMSGDIGPPRAGRQKVRAEDRGHA
jgi:hypothetical protein